jgi:hypothetical protein
MTNRATFNMPAPSVLTYANLWILAAVFERSWNLMALQSKRNQN